jgi:hypothetical protein
MILLGDVLLIHADLIDPNVFQVNRKFPSSILSKKLPKVLPDLKRLAVDIDRIHWIPGSPDVRERFITYRTLVIEVEMFECAIYPLGHMSRLEPRYLQESELGAFQL